MPKLMSHVVRTGTVGLGTGVKIASTTAHFHGFGVARQGPWITWVNKVRATRARSPRRDSSRAKSYQPSLPAAGGRTLRLAPMCGRLPRSVLIMAIVTSAPESSAAPVVRSEASYWLTTTPISAHKTAPA